ncbi:hypothetical protein SEA_MUFASA8_83 [Arthrobacter phage Mufasa8]|uniref:Uncharacterized protein n=1 Tax=Arthrobacter phage Mufasa8 TaxID=2656526 RepID=A0A649VMS2_9CAUD|nr:hypothetical protein HYQ08_gp083 [Arthrobacter phage Mufasa8]QGJ93531.1 hypothetical protein SEA_MUFASA8_83 [Arthrobacter phage Mufasa8]
MSPSQTIADLDKLVAEVYSSGRPAKAMNGVRPLSQRLGALFTGGQLVQLSVGTLTRLDDLAAAFRGLGEAAARSAEAMTSSTQAFHARCRCQSSPQLAAKPHRPILNLPHNPRLRDGRGLHHGYGPKGKNRR